VVVTHDSKIIAERLQRKVMMQNAGVERPDIPGDCWALKRIYTGATFASFVNCSKKARQGYRTCRWHADREEDAQVN
jgi:hypothetical protein